MHCIDWLGLDRIIQCLGVESAPRTIENPLVGLVSLSVVVFNIDARNISLKTEP